MKSLPKPVLTAGIAVISAGAVAVAPNVQPPAHLAPDIQLAAALSPQRDNPFPFLADLTPSGVSTAVPDATVLADPVPEPAADSTGNTIKAIYDAVEPWVAYAVDVTVYALDWVS